MQWTSPWAGMLGVIVFSLLISARPNDVPSGQPTRVEIWRGADDGLTLRLADALERELRTSPAFTLSVGKKAGTLLVTIPTNLSWKRFFGRTKALFIVEFSSADGRLLGGSNGACWENEFQKCASQIVRDAEIAARKIR